MKDQAEALRNLMAKRAGGNKTITNKTMPRILAITSGKGGVGKTNLAVNLAISMRRSGYSVLILDADIGLSNVEILLGMNIRYNITDLITGNITINEIIGEGPEGVKVISGGTGFYELSIMDGTSIEKVLKEFQRLENSVDFIIIDTGAGVSNTVLDFVKIADEVMLVITPDPTSIMDGYTMIKALTIKGYKGKLNIVANMVNNRREAENLFYKLNEVSRNFLKVNLCFTGYLEKSVIVNKAIINQEPFLISNPRSSISKRIDMIKQSYCSHKERLRKANFTQRLKEFFYRRGD